MSEGSGPGFGGVVEGAPPGLANRRFQRRLAQDAAGHLEEGEKLLSPAAVGAQGGMIFLLSAAGVLAVTVVLAVVALDRMGAAGDVLGSAGIGLFFLLTLLHGLFSPGCAVVLTDRRLLIFRTGRLSTRVREMLTAVPRSEVSADFWAWSTHSVLRLEVPSVADRAPMKLNLYFLGWATPAARSIYDALMTPAGDADARPWPGRAT